MVTTQPPDEHDAIEIAERAGLIHRPSDRVGITRRRRGGGFSFARPNGSLVSSQVVRDAIATAAEALGNTVAVCRSSYVAPVAIEAFEDGRLADCWKRTRRGRWLSRAERATARLLRGS